MDDGSEHHDASVPFTTSCPYLPGQPVNLLFVPIEVQPLRFRSASMSSMANGDIRTMNPRDKFMTPRPPPPTPSLPRLNTASSVLMKGRTSRSLSPKAEKSPWSPRAFFGLRSHSPSSLLDRRGRSSSLSKVAQDNTNASTPSLVNRPDEINNTNSIPHTRDASPQSFRKVPSREPSPLRQLVQETTLYNTTTFEIPDLITEEAEDDDNFANPLSPRSFDRGMVTPLAPPPSALRSPPPQLRTGSIPKDTSKPLPQIPQLAELDILTPRPLLLRSAFSAAELQPRSHFSTSTFATESVSSPTDSHFSFSSSHSLSSSAPQYDEDLATDSDEFTYSPILVDTPVSGFAGYSLPETEFASEQTLLGQPLRETPSRKTFGGLGEGFGVGDVGLGSGREEEGEMSELQRLLSEMGYLGEAISGK